MFRFYVKCRGCDGHMFIIPSRKIMLVYKTVCELCGFKGILPAFFLSDSDCDEMHRGWEKNFEALNRGCNV